MTAVQTELDWKEDDDDYGNDINDWDDWNDWNEQQTENDLKVEQWEIELDDTFTDGTLEIHNDKNWAIKQFIKCIELEKSNTNIIDKRFDAMLQILLLQSENITDDDIKDDEILNNFEELLKYYNAYNPTEYITTNDFNYSLRSLFNSIKANCKIKLLLKLSTFAYKYFDELNIANKQHIEFTLNILKTEYIDKFNIEYTPNISKCDQYDMYNAINDSEGKTIIDLGSNDEYCKMHMNGAINIDISKKLQDEWTFDKLFGYIKNRTFVEIYCYYHSHSNNDDNYDIIQYIQKLIWNNTMQIIPIYIYQHNFDTFYTKYYPFLCRSVGCDKPIQVKYPNHIINDKLFLGNMDAARNDQILKQLQITHIVNCTPFDYDNDITRNSKHNYLQISINDECHADISKYFNTSYDFIDAAMHNHNNRILVHCQAGVSRSSSIVISYLMKKYDMKLSDSICLVKSKRPQIEPNSGFMKQLENYAKKITK